jgi:hypothetical protein
MRIIIPEFPFIKIFADTILPIWDYGKNDRMIQLEMDSLLGQFHTLHTSALAARLHQEVKIQLDKHSL